MSEIQWFYAREDRSSGPVSDAALREMAGAGELYPTDLLWREGWPAWQPAGRVEGLFPPGRVPPPLPVQYRTVPLAPIEEDATMRLLLPVGRSGWAIVAGYLGLFSVLMFPAPFAVICSIVAIRDIRTHPHRHGMGRAIFGLIMGSLGSLLLLALMVRAIGR